ncbi:DUF1961 family protein [Puniceicoccus vermicola]|uniref:DUF1961 family protein n=1 Tax=Puniceicoccus vermicola TaxID=388746 RepID=A0A7X1B159_9BACT|nr:DUF1961 family protein [Puniceicoccus vermicola]MBC2603647.1 DUF1961 family protein [Puniceicoccus vermicola]
MKNNSEELQKCFDELDRAEWNELFHDSGKENWEDKWFLDGEVAGVENTPYGMSFSAGPRFANNAHHAVLWTREQFEGDVKIEYNFTRTDFAERCVAILYVQATGPGEKEDIVGWNDQRKVPNMSIYFNGMHTYHISYAAFGNSFETDVQYIRARRYMPGSESLEGTALPGDYDSTHLFQPGVPHQISVIKRGGRELFMRIRNPETTVHLRWYNEDLPAIESGRIGIRHMATRSGLYSDFRVCGLA